MFQILCLFLCNVLYAGFKIYILSFIDTTMVLLISSLKVCCFFFVFILFCPPFLCLFNHIQAITVTLSLHQMRISIMHVSLAVLKYLIVQTLYNSFFNHVIHVRGFSTKCSFITRFRNVTVGVHSVDMFALLIFFI